MLLALCGSAHAAHVTFNFADFSTLTTPLTNRVVLITPLSTPRVDGPSVITSDTKKYTTDSSAVFTVSNMVYGNYRVQIPGPYTITPFTILVPETNALLNATGLITSTITVPGATAGYSQTASDARFMRTNGVRVAAGSNSVVVTNVTSAYTLYTVHATATGGGGTGAVSSVNGQDGAVLLTTAEVDEQDPFLYWNTSRSNGLLSAANTYTGAATNDLSGVLRALFDGGTNAMAAYVRLQASNDVRVAAGSGGTVSTSSPSAGVMLYTIGASGGSGSGETNTSSNVGSGVGIANAKSLADLPFKSFTDSSPLLAWSSNANEINLAFDWITATQSLATAQYADGRTSYVLTNGVRVGRETNFNFLAGANITLLSTNVNGTNTIMIASAAGAGEANTLSVVGSGVGIVNPKSGVNIPLKSVTSANSWATTTTNANELIITLVQSIITNGLATVAYVVGTSNLQHAILLTTSNANWLASVQMTNDLNTVLRAHVATTSNALFGFDTDNYNELALTFATDIAAATNSQWQATMTLSNILHTQAVTMTNDTHTTLVARITAATNAIWAATVALSNTWANFMFQPGVIYVRTNGGDFSGSIGLSPFLTISNAFLHVTNNTIVDIGVGSFWFRANENWGNTNYVAHPMKIRGLSNVTVRGAGKHMTTLYSTNMGNGFLIMEGLKINIKDFTLRGVRTNAGPVDIDGLQSAIAVAGTNGFLTFENLVIRDWQDHGIGSGTTGWSTNSEFRNCDFVNIGYTNTDYNPNGIEGYGADGAAIPNMGAWITIQDCYFKNCLRSWELEGQSGPWGQNHSKFIGNTVEDNVQTSILIIPPTSGNEWTNRTDILIANNTFIGNAPGAISDRTTILVGGGQDISVIDNHFIDGRGQACISFDAHVNSTILNSRIDGNLIERFGEGNGISVTDQTAGPAYTVRNVVVENNTVRSVGAYALQGSGNDIIFRNNVCEDFGLEAGGGVGMRVLNFSPWLATNLFILGNTFRNSPTNTSGQSGINNLSGAVGTKVHGNVFESLGGASIIGDTPTIDYGLRVLAGTNIVVVTNITDDDLNFTLSVDTNVALKTGTVLKAGDTMTGTLIQNSNITFLTSQKFFDTTATNFVADLNVGERWVDLTNHIHVVHSTNRNANYVSTASFTLWTGNTNRYLTANANWFTNGLPLLMASNKFYRVSVQFNGRTAHETNVLAAVAPFSK